MQDRMRHPADVLIHRKPLRDNRGIERRAIVLRIAVAIEIPARIDERVHRVRFPSSLAGTFRTLYVDKGRNVFKRRPPLARDLHIDRQNHRQIALRNRHRPALRTMNHRNRRAPIPLPRNSPIFQSIRDLRFAESLRSRIRAHHATSLFARQPRELARFLHHAVIAERRLRRFIQRAIGRPDHRNNRQSIRGAEFEIAFIMSRHRHDRARSIIHQHEIADPDRQPSSLSAERINGESRRRMPLFVDIARTLLRPRIDHLLRPLAPRFVQKLLRDRMLRRQDLPPSRP